MDKRNDQSCRAVYHRMNMRIKQGEPQQYFKISDLSEEFVDKMKEFKLPRSISQYQDEEKTGQTEIIFKKCECVFGSM